MCRLLDERHKISMNGVHSRSGARQGAIAPLAEPRKQALLRMHRRKQGDGVVPYVEPLSRSNAALCRLLDERIKNRAHLGDYTLIT